MSRIWGWVICGAIVYACISGHANAADAVLSSGEAAVSLGLMLLATMTLWSGLMEILAASGDLERLGRLVRRIMAPLFGNVDDDECWAAISMNLAANLLGLGNAATPSGIRAAGLLRVRGEAGMRALATLLVLNNAGLQILPTTVMTMRHAAGSAQPGCVWLPGLAASAASVVVGLLTLTLLRRRASMR